MDGLIWNFQGAGRRNFSALIRDYICMYRLNFVALLEPRVSGVKTYGIVKKIGLDGGVCVEANGFSEGIWCLWNQSRQRVHVLSTTRFCVHLQVNPFSPQLLGVDRYVC